MELIIANSYEEMSGIAAADIVKIMQAANKPLLCPATGHTTIGLYKKMARMFDEKKYNPHNWFFAGLDEWMGMNIDNEKSCHFRITEELFNKIGVKREQICFFDGTSEDLNAECEKMENFITNKGPLTLAILGLGVNGHVGMNEPFTSANSRSHIAQLDEITQQVGQKYFKEPQQITAGITLGLGTLLESENIFLLVNGTHKAAIIKKVIEEEITEAVPASILRNHPALKIYLDAEAAELLK